MLTENQEQYIIIFLLFIIIYFLFKKEKFTSECKNRDCYECSGSKEVYRNYYCLDNTVQKTCPDDYKLDSNTNLCVKSVINENKVYEFEAPTNRICNNNEIQVGDVCVTEANHYFDPKYYQ